MFNYLEKYKSYLDKTLYSKLPSPEQELVKDISFRFKLTFQEFRQLVNVARDLDMWNETTLSGWWKQQVHPIRDKKIFLQKLDGHLLALRQSEKKYTLTGPIIHPPPLAPVVYSRSAKNPIGLCPVASPKTLCCQLQTIDAVENCPYGCSYCTIQTFYTDRTVINTGLREKLSKLKIEDGRYYHFGSGQSSDSLALGNLGGILDDLCSFAADHPNVLMEFKTKSKNIKYFLENNIPPNIVCSWTLNPEIIIRHEEHFTARLKERLNSARKLADRGIKVAFHFHPLIYYQGWDKDYPAIAVSIMDRFDPAEVLYLSFGSLTLIKPVIQRIRNLGIKTKTLQMELVADPVGKWTYPDAIKIKLFARIYNSFKPWRDKVYMYLCMEKPELWLKVFGYRYRDNAEFEQDFARKTIGRIYKLR